jgi:hypothetical protein
MLVNISGKGLSNFTTLITNNSFAKKNKVEEFQFGIQVNKIIHQ